MNFSDYVCVYPNVLPPKTCKQYIDLFERDSNLHVRRDEGPFKFTEVNVNHTDWDINPLIQSLLTFRKQYFFQCNITEKNFNHNHSYEEFRMKRYLPYYGDVFKIHTDAWDLKSSKRFIVMFWYLNNVDEGGETEFYNLDKEIKVKPTEGTLIMFPATWQYLHAGLAPISDSKYIIGTYFHYGE